MKSFLLSKQILLELMINSIKYERLVLIKVDLIDLAKPSDYYFIFCSRLLNSFGYKYKSQVR